MLRLIPVFLWITLAITSAGCSGTSKIDVGRLLTSGRDGWQHPERVITALEIQPGDRVAEIGAGSGYWLRRLSDAVGSGGRVYAVEVEAELVAALEERVAKEKFTNVEVIFGAYDDPRLPDGEIDLAMTCLTYHHIEGHVDYFRALHVDLSPRGRVVHLDDRPDSPAPISWFQSADHWTDPAEIAVEMGDAGYARSRSFDFLPAQSFQIFVPGDGPVETQAGESAADARYAEQGS